MKKLVVLSGGLVAVGSAALVGAGIAMSQPGGSQYLNVVGEPYNKALQILKAQGITSDFRRLIRQCSVAIGLPGRQAETDRIHGHGASGHQDAALAGLQPGRRRPA